MTAYHLTTLNPLLLAGLSQNGYGKEIKFMQQN
jgi:hypothetical protein